MNMTRVAVLSLSGAALLLLTACGEVGFKMGAGAGALEADQASCKQAGGGPAAYKACMNAKGWTIADLDAAPSSTYVPPKPVAGSAMTTSAPMAMPSSPGSPAMPATSTATPMETAPPPTDPMTPVPVTAWVKFGGGSPDDSIATCVSTLGPAYAPDKVHKTVTVALLACMRGQGWRAF
jgi:hypothetical protein